MDERAEGLGFVGRECGHRARAQREHGACHFWRRPEAARRQHRELLDFAEGLHDDRERAVLAAARRREPAVPRAQLARLIMAAVDGVVLQFAASGDIATARDDLAAFGRILATAADRRR